MFGQVGFVVLGVVSKSYVGGSNPGRDENPSYVIIYVLYHIYIYIYCNIFLTSALKTFGLHRPYVKLIFIIILIYGMVWGGGGGPERIKLIMHSSGAYYIK